METSCLTTKLEPTTQLFSSPAIEESLPETRYLHNDISAAASRDGNTSTAATVSEHGVTIVDPDSGSAVLVSCPERSSVSSSVPSSGTNETTRLKYDNATVKDLPKVPAANSLKAVYQTCSEKSTGSYWNKPGPEVNRDGRDARIRSLEQELESARKANQDFRNKNTNLKKTIDIYAHGTAALEHNLKREKSSRKRAVEDLDLLQRSNSELERGNTDLQRKLDKKNESYKEMAKNYMDQVRPIRVTDDDTSTIYNRLTQIRVSIEQLIQRARGNRSVNLNKDVALEYIKNSELFAGMVNLEPELSAYHLDLCMESVVMSTLVYYFFRRPLGCIFENDENFEDIHGWVYERDTKIADRWRQQLCVMALQDSSMQARRKYKVEYVVDLLSEMVSRVYSNVDMSVKITELCDKALELAIAMFGFEYVISPIFTPLGTPFDDETMTMPQKSNPAGTVTLVIFPAFGDNSDTFNMKAKVWCK
ncbi:hypothetical protein EDD21DRAFT_385445 [Dissophora ornata]|nr:hypothetical protein EDD21DRAFT_385445 [Dissophora ornata]